jgi:hypothetical protein
VPEFLAEVYVSSASEGASLPRVEDVARAADQVTRDGEQVQLLRLILVPDDETCFYLYRAESAQAVVSAGRRVGLRFDRVVEAASGSPASSHRPLAPNYPRSIGGEQ